MKVRLTEDGHTEKIELNSLDFHARTSGLASLTASLLSSPEIAPECPICGWTRSQFDKTKLLGCGLCHTVFANEVEAYLANEPSDS